MDFDDDDEDDDYERELSPLERFVSRAKDRIWRCEWQAKLAEAKARVAESRKKPPRKGRSRRPRRVSGNALAARQKPA
jgi:hypothetical protein